MSNKRKLEILTPILFLFKIIKIYLKLIKYAIIKKRLMQFNKKANKYKNILTTLLGGNIKHEKESFVCRIRK